MFGEIMVPVKNKKQSSTKIINGRIPRNKRDELVELNGPYSLSSEA